MSYTVNDIRQQCDAATFSRGDAYRRDGHVRDAGVEAGALSHLDFSGADPKTSPLGGLHGELQLAGENDWLRLAGGQSLASLRAQGCRIEHGAGFRFELATVDDWYAQVVQQDGAGSAWFDMHLRCQLREGHGGS